MAEKKQLVVIGNGMAGARFVEEMVSLGGQEFYDITVIGEETWGNYNRILLSGVLSGSHHPDDIFINPLGWYSGKRRNSPRRHPRHRHRPQREDGLRSRRTAAAL